MRSALDVRVGVKPVSAHLIHSAAWEGPCRVGDTEELTSEAERAKGKKAFKEFQEEWRRNLSSEAKLLEPVYIEYNEDFVVSEKEFKKLEPDLQNTDLFLLSYRVPGIERYRKPVAMMGRGVTNVDIAAYFRSRGLEGYAPIDYDELNELISLMQVRKAIRETRILAVTGGELITWGVVSSIWDLENLKAKFGTDCYRISIKRFFDEMDKVDQKEVTELSEKLIKGAQKLNIKEDYVANDVKFYLATKSLMEKYDCNAHTTPCFELCSSRVPEKLKVVPCLTHTLLKDEGYPSSCEGDISVLLAMMVLMYVSKKSSFMGNPWMKDEDIIQLTHSVPGLKMNGFDKPDLPYELWHFTAAGWGTKMQIDMAKNEEKEVTLARFNPLATKIQVVGGRIVGCCFHERGCSPTVDIQVNDAREIIHQQVDFGHHMAMVYGDYTRQIEKLSTLMGFEVVKI
jgi:hypothetical protein